MEIKICMNNACQAKYAQEWKEGWKLKSGEIATLCYNCGLIYEKSAFCETYHTQENGWRSCRCGKHIHCGCIASNDVYECQDFGGVLCAECVKSNSITSPVQIPGTENEVEKEEEIMPQQGAESAGHPNFSQQPSEQMDYTSPNAGYKEEEEADGPVPPQVLDFPINDNCVTDPTSDLPFPGEIAAGSQQNDPPQAQNPVQVFPICATAPHSGQELQQTPENSNITIIVPLFEKRLTKTDASKAGRFNIPKACAEAHLPKLNNYQTDRHQIVVEDTNGKEWTFQFRFWPNNGSRVYVFDGFIPYIQSMQLQAGDTVTFSRMDPARKLLVGFRKAKNNVNPQDQQATRLAVSIPPGENSSSGAGVNMVTENGFQTSERTLPWPLTIPKGKRARHVGPNNKKTLMQSDDAMELMITDGEAQNFMCPSATSKPTIFIVEQLQLEEHNEPPIFGNFPVDIPVDNSPPTSPFQVDNSPLRSAFQVDGSPPRSPIQVDNSPPRSAFQVADSLPRSAFQVDNSPPRYAFSDINALNMNSLALVPEDRISDEDMDISNQESNVMGLPNAEICRGLDQQVSMDNAEIDVASGGGFGLRNGHQNKRQEFDLNFPPPRDEDCA